MFAHRLALAIGRHDVDRMLAEMSAVQLQEWYAYYCAHPFGQDHSDYMMAQLAAIAYNRNRGRSEQPIEPADFLPVMRNVQQTPAEMRAALQIALERVK